VVVLDGGHTRPWWCKVAFVRDRRHADPCIKMGVRGRGHMRGLWCEGAVTL